MKKGQLPRDPPKVASCGLIYVDVLLAKNVLQRGMGNFAFMPPIPSGKNHLEFCGLRSLREEQYHLLGGRLSQLHGEVEDVRSAFAIEMVGSLLERLCLVKFNGFIIHYGLN